MNPNREARIGRSRAEGKRVATRVCCSGHWVSAGSIRIRKLEGNRLRMGWKRTIRLKTKTKQNKKETLRLFY